MEKSVVVQNKILNQEESLSLVMAERNASIAAANLDGARAGYAAAQLNVKHCERELEAANATFETIRAKLGIEGNFKLDIKTGELIPED